MRDRSSNGWTCTRAARGGRRDGYRGRRRLHRYRASAKSEHWVTALGREGRKVLDKPLPNDEARLRVLYDKPASHGSLLVVVDQPATIGALAAARCRLGGHRRLAPPAELKRAGKARIDARLKKHGCRRHATWAAQIVSALECQSVTVDGTDAAAVVLPHLTRRLITPRAQRADVAAQVETLAGGPSSCARF